MDQGLRYLAGIICLYAFSEFVLQRLFRKSAPITRMSVLQTAGLNSFVLIFGTLGFTSWRLIVGILMVMAVRTLGDIYLWSKSQVRCLEKFFVLQGFTVLLLIFVWRTSLPIDVHEWYRQLEIAVAGDTGTTRIWLGKNFIPGCLILSGYFFVIDGCARIVRGTLDKFPALMANIRTNGEGNTEARGEWIGILERMITLTFVLTGDYGAVAFALAAKSIARFNELDKKDFAEYYLLGTSASVASALLAGSLIRLFM